MSIGMIAAAAITLTNCTKNEITSSFQSSSELTIFASADGSKTTNNGLKTNWAEGDALNVFYAKSSTPTAYSSNVKFTLDEGSSFKGTATLNSNTNYDWYALYPYSNKVTTPAAKTSGYIKIGGNSQSQSGANSKAHLAGDHMPLYGVAKNVSSSAAPTIQMHQLSSVIEVKVTNTSGEEASISSVAFTAPVDICGTYYVDFTGAAPVYTSSGEQYVYKTANLTVANGKIANNATASFYIAVKPFTAPSGSKLVLSVNGSAKEITLSSDATFSAGKIKTVNYTLEKPAEIEELTVTQALTKVGDGKTYKITGTVDNIDNTKYGNFDLVEGSSKLYIYGLLTPEGEAEKFSTLDVAEGDILTILGTVKDFNSKIEVEKAIYVSNQKVPTISVTPESLQFSSEGESKTVAVTTNNFTGNVNITASSNNSHFTTSVSGNTVTITASANTSTADATGTITITASNGTTSKQTTVSVKQDGKVDTSASGTVTFDFSTDAGLAALGIAKPAPEGGTEISGNTYTVSPISFTSTDGGTKTRVYQTKTGGNLDLRLYKSGGSFTLTSSSNYITKIVFEGSDFPLTPSVGSLVSEKWTGSAKSVKFSATATAKISKIIVTYGNSSSPADPVDASWSVSPTSVSVEKGKTATAAITSNYDGTLSVSSSAAGVATATISGKTITVTGVAKGTATLTVTGAATSNYKAVSKTISVTVTEPSAPGTEPTTSIDFSTKGYANAAAVTEVKIDDNVTAIFSQGTGTNAPKYYTTGTAVRCYGGNKVTISAPGKTITNIKLYFSSGEGNNAITANVGSFVSPTWTGSSESVVLTIGGTTGHRRISKIDVTYN